MQDRLNSPTTAERASTLSGRNFLTTAGIVSAGGFLAACAPATSTPQQQGADGEQPDAAAQSLIAWLGSWTPTESMERRLYPRTPGLYSCMEQYYTSYGRVMAGLLLGSLPLVLLFLFTSRLFVEGLTSGAIKT